jgi:hypothetical protein
MMLAVELTISKVLWPTFVLHPGFIPEKFGVNQKGISKKMIFHHK